MDKPQYHVPKIEIRTSMTDVKQAAELMKSSDFNFEPTLDQGYIKEVSLVPNNDISGTATHIRTLETYVQKLRTATNNVFANFPTYFRQVASWYLNSPRKLKKHWNSTGLFVSTRSKHGRQTARRQAQLRRKQDKIDMHAKLQQCTCNN